MIKKNSNIKTPTPYFWPLNPKVISQRGRRILFGVLVSVVQFDVVHVAGIDNVVADTL